jgi:hypothetical protein
MVRAWAINLRVASPGGKDSARRNIRQSRHGRPSGSKGRELTRTSTGGVTDRDRIRGGSYAADVLLLRLDFLPGRVESWPLEEAEVGGAGRRRTPGKEGKPG